MVGGLVIVPLVSLISPKIDKTQVEEMFKCYDEKIQVTAKTVLVEEEPEA